MSDETTEILKIIEEFERNRIFWLRISGFVCFVMIIVISQWDRIMISHTQWIFASFGMLISACWWYWIMKLVRSNLQQRRAEMKILGEVVEDIGALRDDLTNNN